MKDDTTQSDFSRGDTAELFSPAPQGEAVASAIVPDPCAHTAYPTDSYKNRGARVPAAPAPRAEATEADPSRQGSAEAGHAFGLIADVKILAWPQRYNYYGRFCADAERFFSVRGEECPSVPYFSYIPQYAQLNHAQLSYYFYFRACARRGVYLPDVDLPYILLYIYEIINLPHRIAPAVGAEWLAGVWLAYRAARRELDRYLSEWMCDYCLLRGVPLPPSIVSIIPEILPKATLKEFYISAAAGGNVSPEALILTASDYSFRASRYYSANREAYETHIPAAVKAVTSACGITPTPDQMKRVRVERDAFCGSLCSQTVKRRIIVEYYSFARSYALRRAVTAAVKLSENCLRRTLKIRSRLNTDGAPPDIAAAVASYFGENFPASARRAAPAEDRSYERLYDAPSESIDFAAARALEARSWETTEALVPDFAAESPAEGQEAAPAPAPRVSNSDPQASDGEGEERVPYRAALDAVLAGGSLIAWCKAQGKRLPAAAVAGAINDYAADTLGDIVLAEDGGDYILIEEYREDVRAWLI